MDKYRLEYEIKRRGITKNQFCNDIGISRSALFRKMNGKTEFTLSEIQRIIDYLHLDNPMEIFFADKVS